jgi:hypothetical protein
MAHTQVINSLWSMFIVRDDGGFLPGAPATDAPDAWGANGLIGMPARSYATIVTGTRYGPVRLTVETHDSPPPVDLDAWTDIVEVTFEVVSGVVLVTDWNGEPVQELDVPVGPIRVRVHVRGRDEGQATEWDYDDPNPVEDHLVQFFPGDGGEIIHKATDRLGQHFRQS